MNHISLNGEILPADEAFIPAVTSGLYYGAGAFETFLCEDGRVFKFQDHIKRLKKALLYLGMPKSKSIVAGQIKNQIRNLLEKNYLLEKTARIRIQVSLAESNGYSSSAAPSIITIITATEIVKKRAPVKLILSDTCLVSSSAKPSQYKLSNMLHYRQAYREAQKKGHDDAVMLNTDGFVGETSIANIFWKKDENIFTPSEDCDILPGIMRKSLLDILLNRLTMNVKEGRFRMKDLFDADLVWISNSVRGVVPVMKVGSRTFAVEYDFYSELDTHLSTYKAERWINV